MKVHPKLRINVPRLPMATMIQRKFQFQGKDKAISSDTNKGSIRAKPRISLGSVFSSVLGNKRYSFVKYPSTVKKNGKVKHDIAARALSNEFEPKPVAAALSQLFLLEQALENNQRGEGKHSRMEEQRLKFLLGFLEKKKGWNSFITAKWRASKNDLHGVVARFGQVRRKVGSWRLVRIPSKLVVIRLKLKMIRSSMKKKGKKVDEDNDRELCKKRILMGRKCRPLCSPSPGYLSYDTDKLLLPEIIS
ncbi:uncharacterized protein LOC123888538 [Trifolium pratense]|uniref:uncharacterized protein LOC123888538 n=1 Tax=Trifolium pratense TaxID=57577 RepID=UPI001E690C4B|nr:uncharacterized protein LOC123888538 [Trifolium pratense]